MDLLHHPAFQSFVLPVAVSLVGVGVLRTLLGPHRGPRWAAAAAGLALLIAMTQLPGFAWPTASTPQKLPWLVLAAWALALMLEAFGVGRWLQAAGAALLWLAANLWLAPAGGSAGPVAPLPSAANGVAGAVAGLAILVLLTLSVAAPGTAIGVDEARAANGAGPVRADAAAADGASGLATLAVASLGLAGLVANASLLLAQIAVMIAAASAGLALWLWPRARVRHGAIAALPLALAWLGLAKCALQLTPLAPAHLAVLALAFAAAPLLGALQWRRRWLQPLVVAVFAALPAAAAIAWQVSAPPAADAARPGNADDPYYAPKWK